MSTGTFIIYMYMHKNLYTVYAIFAKKKITSATTNQGGVKPPSSSSFQPSFFGAFLFFFSALSTASSLKHYCTF
jgi:hypothetical protein